MYFLNFLKTFIKSFFVKRNLITVTTNTPISIGGGKIRVTDLMSIDVNTGIIEIHRPITIKSTENIKIYSDKHIMLNTSRSVEVNRPGYNYSVWINSDLDEEENPIKYEFFIDLNGNSVLMEAKYDEEGNLIIPKGYLLPNENLDDTCNH